MIMTNSSFDLELKHFPEEWTPVFRKGSATTIDSGALPGHGPPRFMVSLSGKRSS
jgi:hypothetical protein